jgi:hypothetical protein
MRLSIKAARVQNGSHALSPVYVMAHHIVSMCRHFRVATWRLLKELMCVAGTLLITMQNDSYAKWSFAFAHHGSYL